MMKNPMRNKNKLQRLLRTEKLQKTQLLKLKPPRERRLKKKKEENLRFMLTDSVGLLLRKN